VTRSAAVLACAVLIGCVGCNESNNHQAAAPNGQNGNGAMASDAGHESASASNDKQVTLEGCVQRGGGTIGSGFLLTMLNTPDGVAGTTGSVTKSGSSVEREQMRVAAQTYRLNPKGDAKLDDKVGKQVRVTGVITDNANLPNGSGAIGSNRDTQPPNRDSNSQEDRNPRLNTTDLAKVDVSSAVVTGESCGSIGSETSGTTDGRMAGTPRTPPSNR
jgi:hypothetical protein